MSNRPIVYMRRGLKDVLLNIARRLVDHGLGDRLIVIYGIRNKVGNVVNIYLLKPVVYWDSHGERMEPLDVSIADHFGSKVGLRIVGIAHIHNFGGWGHRFLSGTDKGTLRALTLLDPYTLVIVLDPSSRDGVGVYWQNPVTGSIEALSSIELSMDPQILYRSGRAVKIRVKGHKVHKPIIAKSSKYSGVESIHRPILPIVVLSGGYLTEGRLRAAIHLVNSIDRVGHRAVLVISSLDSTDVMTIVARSLTKRENLATIIAEGRSASTIDNAYYVSRILTSLGARHMVLVTSRFHMRRALMLFRKAMGKEFMIIPCPVPDEPTHYLLLKEYLAQLFVMFVSWLVSDGNAEALRRIQRIKILLALIERPIAARSR